MESNAPSVQAGATVAPPASAAVTATQELHRRSSGSEATAVEADEQAAQEEKPNFDKQKPKTDDTAPAADAPPLQRVPTSHFDPEGVAELSRRLSHVSQAHSTSLPDPADEDNFDFEKFLKRLRARNEADGVIERELGVLFEDLSVQGQGGGAAMAPTMGDILQLPVTIFKGIQSARHARKKNIIEGFSGLVKPGEMLLVLGRPGAGCSTLLKSLTGYVDSFKGMEGDISYDGFAATDLEGELAYLPEDDIHFPLLTVGETLRFAAASRTPSKAARPAGMSRKEYSDLLVDLYLTLFGLRQQVNTKVGNDVVRGVSGGQRKRVSIIEMLLTRAKVSAHDNSTRGLDSSTSLEYVQALRLATDLQKLTTIASLYQCSEALYELFDKVCLVSNGQMLYFGPGKGAPEYFKELGFEQHFGQTSADFLVSITDPNARAVQEGKRPPLTDAGLAESYQQSTIADAQRAERDQWRAQFSAERQDQISRSRQSEAVKRARKGYLTNYIQQINLSMIRRFQLLRGNLPTTLIQTGANIFQALIIGSVFYDITDTTQGFFSRGGVIFFAILFNALTGMAEIPALYAQRSILVRQRRYRMARPSTDALAQTLTDLPVKGVTILAFDLILYWITGLKSNAGAFFTFLLFTIIASLMMTSYFRMLAAITRAEAQATLLAGVSILVFVITVGYAIPRPSMLGWYRWYAKWFNPLGFAFEALLANELHGSGSPCASLVPSGPGYEGASLANQACPLAGYDPTTGLVRGDPYLQDSYVYYFSHVWRNLGIMFCFWAGFLAIQTIASEIQRDEAAAAAVVLFRKSKETKDIQKSVEKPDVAGDPEAVVTEKANMDTLTEEQKSKAAGNAIVQPKEVLTWRHVCYDIPVKEGTRRLLNNISGFVAPGKLTALMGESGAGKTTLLNVLAQRVNMGVVYGDLMVNNHELPISFQRQTGYAQQQDLHLEQTTVREALQFSALLRQPASVPKEEKLAYAEEIIHLLEMESYAEAVVGEPGAGLGVEQRKKLTIGVELAAKPSLLLFLDEPTSGLDSQSAWAIVQLLRKLAQQGMSLLVTIHQPSGELFNQFDRLILLQRGGETVYQGDLGKNCSTVIGYFENASQSKIPKGANPAEWILEVVGAGATAKKSQNFGEVWNKSDLAQKVQTDIDALHNDFPEPVHNSTSNQTFAAPFWYQLWILTKRGYVSYWRNPTYLMAKFGLNIVGGLFIGFTFFKAPNSVAGLQVNLFSIFMALVLSSPLSQSIAPVFINLRSLFEVREQPSRMYHWTAFTTSAVLVELPWNAVGTTIFFLCWQWTVGLTNTAERTGYLYAVMILFSMWFAGFMQAISAMAPNAEIASLLFAVLFSFVVIFCGVLQPPPLMPTFWREWMPHLATFTYIADSLLSTSIGGGKQVVCRESEFAIIEPPSGQTCQDWLGPFIEATTGYLTNPQAESGCQYCQYRTGDEYLDTVGYSYSHRARNIGIIIAYVVFNFFLLYALYYVFRVRGAGAKADYQPASAVKPIKGKDREEVENKA